MISEQMTRDKQIINRLFGIFVLAYLIGALYYFFFGEYSKLICNLALKWAGQDFIVVIMDIPAAFAIFWLHRKSY